MNVVEIHEFSTGIEVKQTPRGWESGGFTGEYMNRTIDPIPKAVLDAIANREFALAEGTAIATPAMVGREVTGYGETWSVVAVVTRGTDDRGRGVSLYRYFLCHGEGYIQAILRWMGRQIRVFDPFETRAMGQPHRAQISTQIVPLKAEFQALLQSPPIIVPATETCMPLILDRMTQELGTRGSRSWAYQVAALERPEYFQVIYPASLQAEAVFRQMLASRPSASVAISGEAAIKTAIKALTNGRVKREHIQTLENACGNPNVDDKFWNTVLDKQGVSQALKDSMYGSRNIRLLTLKAILLPKFLPDFLLWLSSSKQSDEHYQFSLKLQTAIVQHFPKFNEDCPHLSQRIEHGSCIVINRLVDKPQILTEAGFLFSSSNGLWSQVYRRSLSSQLEHDISLMRDHVYGKQGLVFQATKYPEWNELLGRLYSFWRSPGKRDSRYSNLAMLFEAAGTPKLAAIFYQISDGCVPKSVFLRVSANEWRSVLFGMPITRKMEFGDYVDLFLYEPVDIGGIEMSRAVAVFILAIAFVLGLGGGWKAKEISTKDAQRAYSSFYISSNLVTNEIKNWLKDMPKQMSLEGRRQAIENLKSTQTAINNIKNALESESLEPGDLEALNQRFQGEYFQGDDNPGYEEGFINGLKMAFELDEDFSYSNVKPENPQATQQFVNAIYNYQLNHDLPADGIISPDGATQKKLREDIRTDLLDAIQQDSEIDQPPRGI